MTVEQQPSAFIHIVVLVHFKYITQHQYYDFKNQADRQDFSRWARAKSAHWDPLLTAKSRKWPIHIFYEAQKDNSFLMAISLAKFVKPKMMMHPTFGRTILWKCISRDLNISSQLNKAIDDIWMWVDWAPLTISNSTSPSWIWANDCVPCLYILM